MWLKNAKFYDSATRSFRAGDSTLYAMRRAKMMRFDDCLGSSAVGTIGDMIAKSVESLKDTNALRELEFVMKVRRAHKRIGWATPLMRLTLNSP